MKDKRTGQQQGQAHISGITFLLFLILFIGSWLCHFVWLHNLITIAGSVHLTLFELPYESDCPGTLEEFITILSFSHTFSPVSFLSATCSLLRKPVSFSVTVAAKWKIAWHSEVYSHGHNLAWLSEEYFSYKEGLSISKSMGCEVEVCNTTHSWVLSKNMEKSRPNRQNR